MRNLVFLLFLLAACSVTRFSPKWTNERAPEVFYVEFETSKGRFEAEITRNLSPLAVDRFYQLVKHQFFQHAVFYRVVPDFVAQFGISDTTVMKNWMEIKVPDEKVVGSNTRGTISFARGEKDSRGTDLFVNLADNLYLDTILFSDVKGFPPIGKVTLGMETVEALYGGYSDSTMDKLDTFYRNRGEFMKTYPQLDSIIDVRITRIK